MLKIVKVIKLLRRLHLYEKKKFNMALTSTPVSYINAQFVHYEDLSLLESKLSNFDSESAYNNLHKELTEKYNLNKEYFDLIEEIRKDLVFVGIEDDGKTELIDNLDAVVSTLQTDFEDLIEEKYRLLDEIFLIKTNSHFQCDLEELARRTEETLVKPKSVYIRELKKIARVHQILEKEENRLMDLKVRNSAKKATFYL